MSSGATVIGYIIITILIVYTCAYVGAALAKNVSNEQVVSTERTKMGALSSLDTLFKVKVSDKENEISIKDSELINEGADPIPLKTVVPAPFTVTEDGKMNYIQVGDDYVAPQIITEPM